MKKTSVESWVLAWIFLSFFLRSLAWNLPSCTFWFRIVNVFRSLLLRAIPIAMITSTYQWYAYDHEWPLLFHTHLSRKWPSGSWFSCSHEGHQLDVNDGHHDSCTGGEPRLKRVQPSTASQECADNCFWMNCRVFDYKRETGGAFIRDGNPGWKRSGIKMTRQEEREPWP